MFFITKYIVMGFQDEEIKYSGSIGNLTFYHLRSEDAYCVRLRAAEVQSDRAKACQSPLALAHRGAIACAGKMTGALLRGLSSFDKLVGLGYRHSESNRRLLGLRKLESGALGEVPFLLTAHPSVLVGLDFNTEVGFGRACSASFSMSPLIAAGGGVYGVRVVWDPFDPGSDLLVPSFTTHVQLVTGLGCVCDRRFVPEFGLRPVVRGWDGKGGFGASALLPVGGGVMNSVTVDALLHGAVAAPKGVACVGAVGVVFYHRNNLGDFLQEDVNYGMIGGVYGSPDRP